MSCITLPQRDKPSITAQIDGRLRGMDDLPDAILADGCRKPFAKPLQKMYKNVTHAYVSICRLIQPLSMRSVTGVVAVGKPILACVSML